MAITASRKVSLEVLQSPKKSEVPLSEKLSKNMSDAERIIGLIGLIMSPSQDQEIELQDDITPDEFTKHFSGGASLTDAIIASAVSIAYFVFRAFRRIR